MMLMQFGQFLDHDISFTPEVNLDSGKFNCCNSPGLSPECFAIEIPQPDPAFPESCHEFVRSTPHCSSPDVRQQLNAITAYVDGSMTRVTSTPYHLFSSQEVQDLQKLHILTGKAVGET